MMPPKALHRVSKSSSSESFSSSFIGLWDGKDDCLGLADRIVTDLVPKPFGKVRDFLEGVRTGWLEEENDSELFRIVACNSRFKAIG